MLINNDCGATEIVWCNQKEICRNKCKHFYLFTFRIQHTTVL